MWAGLWDQVEDTVQMCFVVWCGVGEIVCVLGCYTVCVSQLLDIAGWQEASWCGQLCQQEMRTADNCGESG
jgi:hypothetical protein